jgi:2-polyprenyl-3-methyl-5-hydroxy-6-metoxy-1,4-benzoquinol methylase
MSADVADSISALCASRWHRDYTRIKLRTDPAYAAVLREVRESPLPLLDVGCGIGLLAMYLRGSGFSPTIMGFDYDEGKVREARSMAQRSGFHALSYAAGDARLQRPGGDFGYPAVLHS